ncbi:MAG: Cna B-type domain-containing protein [Solobacterium sp.]|nr:Cna B-type domain-containing protein [Solobacterium sp.]
MTKRILSIILVTLMSVPTFTPVFAEGSEPEPEQPETTLEVVEEETTISEETVTEEEEPEENVIVEEAPEEPQEEVVPEEENPEEVVPAEGNQEEVTEEPSEEEQPEVTPKNPEEVVPEENPEEVTPAPAEEADPEEAAEEEEEEAVLEKPQENISISVKAVWEDEDDFNGYRPESVEVKLYADDQETAEPLTLSENNSWSGGWTDLPKYAEDTEINYTVKETLTDVITGEDTEHTYTYKVKGSAGEGFTVVNTHTPEKPVNRDPSTIGNASGRVNLHGMKAGLTKAFTIIGSSFNAAGDVPAHSKTATDNEDGTYKLELSVTGDADTEVHTAANVNVLIIYDVSQSMTTNVSGTNRSRADNAEDVVHDFIENLSGYQNSDDPSNIQAALVTFGPNANLRSGWTSNLTGNNSGLNRFFDDGVDGTTDPTGQFRYGNNFGTNWEHGLILAQNLLNDPSTDSDPTFVVLFTDGVCTKSGTGGGDGDNPTNQNWTNYRGYYNAATDNAAAIENRTDTTLFGIYAYGNEHDLLDDLIYYANNGSHREMGPYNIMTVPTNQYNTYDFGETEATDNYFNAADTTELTAAIEDIFQTIVQALGVSSAAISDGTTSAVKTSTDEIANLLKVDDSSYEYWLEIPVVNNQFQRINSQGETDTYSVSKSGDSCTVTWGSNSVTVNGCTLSGGKFKYKWESANALYNYNPPAAQFNDPSVDWDLSSVNTLLDGVTYSVTFDVYPSQTTLDIVADIKNDPSSYTDLDSEIKKYIDSDGNLKTNTTATLTYDDTRTPEDERENPVEYTNPDPVETTAVEQLAVSKVWENELDSQGKQPVTLTVTRDDDPCYTVVLSNNNNWQNSVFISVGIMGEDGQPLEGAEGHDFTFMEPQDLTYHWELDVPVVHPMLINGDKTMLIMVDEKHPAPDGAVTYEFNDNTYYVDDGAVALTATNYRRSSLLLTKKVTKTSGTPDPDDIFPFTLNVVNSLAPDAEPEDDPEHNSDWWVWVSVRDKDNNKINDAAVSGATPSGANDGWYYGVSGEDIVLNVKDGYSIRVNNLPSDTTYTITEGDLPAGYTFVSSVLTIEEGDGEDSTFSGDVTSTGTIEDTNTLYKVTYTNDYEVADITVTKVWDDADDQDGLRPDELTLTLNGAPDDFEVPDPEITKDGDEWTYTWKGLPKKDADGEEIEYTVSEDTVPEGYEVDGSPAENGGTITNTHEPETTEIPVKKVWVGPAGDEVTVTLYADGNAISKTVKLNEGNEWEDTFEDLPVYKDGEEIVYSVVEAGVSGVDSSKYTTTISGSVEEGFTITNTNTEKTTVTVTKVWDDGDDQDGIRPTSLQLTLNGAPDDFEVPDPTITKNGNRWTYKWTGLPKYSEDGEEIEYTVSEENVPEGYEVEGSPAENGGEITNKYTPETIDIPVEKVWVGPAGDEVTVTLYADGKATDKTVKLNEGNEWKDTFEDLPVNKNGTPIVYTVVEAGVSGVDKTKYKVTIEGGPEDGYVITNTNTEKTTVTVTKVWDDGDDQDGIRPTSLELTLNGAPDDFEVPEPTITKSGNKWTYKWTGLPKYSEDGEEIEYTVSEENVPEGYEVEGSPAEDGGEITNKYTPETIEITVEKKWVDDENSDGLRPDSVEVTLYAGSSVAPNTEPLTLDESNSWKGTWTDLPKNKNGEPIEYTVKETKTDVITGKDTATTYAFEVTGSAEDGFTVTNTHTPKLIEIKVTKKWDDSNNKDKIRPTKITVHLLADGEEVETREITKADGWKTTFTDLPALKNGKEIKYTIKEDSIKGYTTKITGSASKGFVITNSHKSENPPTPPIDPPTPPRPPVIPNTGDNANMGLWAMLALLSFLALGGLVIFQRRNYTK